MKKKLFKYLIKEFHENKLPKIITRDINIKKTNKIITIIGSRRAGKTFYFYQLITNLLKTIPKNRIIYINFEDDRILPLDFKELDDILETYYELYPENKEKEIYVFFDEIQNITNWELYIRRIYDKEKVKLFITGSNSKLLSKEIATSLRGRTLTFNLYPLSFKEFLRFNNIKIDKNITYSKKRFKIKKYFKKYLIFGGFPEVVLETNNLEQDILKNYFEIMIYKDITERFSIRNTKLLKTLSKYLLTNISNLFSINSYYNYLKEITSVGKETILEYVSDLEEVNMIYLTSFFSYSLKVQQVNPKKVYCIDNGLRNAVSFKFSKDEGILAENLVFIELKRNKKEPYYWKSKKHEEIDFIIKNKYQKLTAINVTYSNEINKREIKALKKFKEEFKSKVKELILITKDLEQKKEGIIYIPLWKWLLKSSKEK